MYNKNIIFIVMMMLCGFNLFGASEKSTSVIKATIAAFGELSIESNDIIHHDFGIVLKSWDSTADKEAGCIAVVAVGGVAKEAAQEIADQFVTKLKGYFTIKTSVDEVIEELNKKYKTQSTGHRHLTSMMIHDICITVVSTGGTSFYRSYGRCKRSKKQVIPVIESKTRPVTLLSHLHVGNDTFPELPIIRWRPKCD